MNRRPFVPLSLRPLAFLLLFISIPASHAQQRATESNAALNSPEAELVREMNLARTRPSDYAAFLEELRPFYEGKSFKLSGDVSLMTQEGVSALDEAIRFLRSTAPLQPLALSKGMCAGARELVVDQSASGATGHRGADGGFCEDRVRRFGAWQGPIGENLSYGDDTARARVIALIIDDGVANRGHRARIFNPAHKVVGVSCGQHQLGGMCVITFAGGFTDGAKALDSAPSKNLKTNVPAGARRF